MEKYFILGKVIALIESREAVREMGRLAVALKNCGIDCSIYSISICREAGKEAAACCWEAGMKADAFPWEAGMKAEACLWVTDSPSWAARITQLDYPLLAYFHEGNRGCDFSMVRHGMESPGELAPDYLDKVYRRCAGIPWNIAETRRCRVRETVVEDVYSFRKIYEDPSVMQYTREQYPDTVREKEYVRAYIENQYGFYNFGVWTIVQKESGTVIGRAGFSFRDGYEFPELGYVIGRAWQRQGIAFEVCGAVLEYGREELGFTRVQTLVETENTPSLNLCRKLGFRETEPVQEKGRSCIRLELVL